VGTLIVFAYQAVAQLRPLRFSGWRSPADWRYGPAAALGVYAGVFAFNLGITAWIGDWELLAASTAVTAATLGFCLIKSREVRKVMP
jgi:hypothetical protein